MAKHLDVKNDLTIPDAELDEQAAGSGGPGGQHANKTDSRVILRWNVRDSSVLNAARRTRLLDKLDHRLNKRGEIVVQADDTRSWHQNRKIARDRLVAMIRAALKKQPQRRATRPTRSSRRRRLNDKRHRGKIKDNRGRLRGKEDV